MTTPTADPCCCQWGCLCRVNDDGTCRVCAAKNAMARAEDDVERRIDAAYDEHRQARQRVREPKEKP